MAILRNNLNSSAFAFSEYDSETKQMELTWRTGETITLQGVPEEVYAAFIAAPSKGGFYHAVLKGTY